ncbi:DUF2188 domain-containing protein [Amycolatopsis sp. NBC_01480]|uniref:DUF2188 domain-containing protein n=1 Tax=Amycolatopsis sp. NBC_01480 TaxID=2903562 RepID=UPI002E2B9B84|nr:DUF2188 domain-containing protein [Amycolatopsis sp. NBC_01480]
MDGGILTYCENGLWKNKVRGHVRASSTSRRREEAIRTGRHMAKARRVAHRVLDEQGEVAGEEDYRTSVPRKSAQK